MAKKSILITQEDVLFIFKGNEDEIKFITSNCYCFNCNKGYKSRITNYKVVLNELYDIVLDGFCAECKGPIGRYVETGDSKTTAKNAEAVWKTYQTLKELKIKKQK